MLTQDRVKELFDYKDGNLFWKVKAAKRTKIGDMAGWVSSKGYKKVRVDRKQEYIHRLIFLMHHGFEPKIVDHVDLNPSNNQISNLRAATREDNARNKNRQKNNTTGFTGVFFRKDSGKFRAIIGINDKLMHLGTYKCPKEAAIAYNQAAIKHHGAFARINKIPQTD